MRIRVSVPEKEVSPHVVNAALEAVTRLDEELIKQGAPGASQLVAAGARWKPEPPGDECFDHVGIIAARGWGDCDDWAPARAAELRVRGEDSGAKAIVVPSGPTTYHAVVQRSDGSIDDPSVAAGMKPLRHSRVSGGEAIEILACDPHDPNRMYAGSLLPTTSPMSLHCGPQFAVRRVVGGCFQGRCDVPMAEQVMGCVRGPGCASAAMPYALSHQAEDVHPASAVSYAVIGAIQTAEATGYAAPSDYLKLLALYDLLSGYRPEQVYQKMRHKWGDGAAHAAVYGAWRVAKRFMRGATRRASPLRRAGRRYGVPGQGTAHAAQRAF